MQQFFIGILIIILIGIGAFLYRGAKEHSVTVVPTPNAQACTQEAKVCPDGTSVGRTGPNCEFAACAAPNVEDMALAIAYVAPAGGVPSSITIQSFPIPAGKKANDIILANTVHETSGLPAKSMSEFLSIPINGKTYESIIAERFEGVVHSEYYLARTNDVLRFDVTDRNVANWTDPKLLVANLPTHQILLKMLSTLQDVSQ